MDRSDDPLALYLKLRSDPKCTPELLAAFWVSLAATTSVEAVLALLRVVEAHLHDDPEPPDLDPPLEPRRFREED